MGGPETNPVPSQNQSQTPSQQESTLGKEYIGLRGVLAIMAYLVLFAAADLYVMVKVWPAAPNPSATLTPPPAPAPTTSPTPTASPSPAATRTPTAAPAASPTPTPSGTPAGGGSPKPAPSPSPTPTPAGPDQPESSRQVDFFWGTYTLTTSSALFLIVMLSGALGTLLRAVRSFYWYTGNRELKWSWAAMYALLPFSGALLGTVFYLIVRGGFMNQPPGSNSAFGFAALAALVALFSEEALLKLKQVAETVLTKPETGKDTAVPAPKVSGISPATGPQAGGTTVTITGDNFNQGAKVNFGGAAAIVGVITKTNISVTTPAHAAGAVDVEVINPDNHNDVRRGAFTYV